MFHTANVAKTSRKTRPSRITARPAQFGQGLYEELPMERTQRQYPESPESVVVDMTDINEAEILETVRQENTNLPEMVGLAEKAVSESMTITPAQFDIAKHNCTVTIISPKTGDHRTFRIRTVRKGKLAGKRILELLIGTDNESDYEGFAFVGEDGMRRPTVITWAKFRGADGRESTHEKYASMIRLPEYWAGLGIKYEFALRCMRCGRLLTHPSSIISGYGPECIKKI